MGISKNTKQANKINKDRKHVKEMTKQQNTHRENDERQHGDREAEQQRRREIAMGLKNFETKCAEKQPDDKAQSTRQLKNLKTLENDNRYLNEKLKPKIITNAEEKLEKQNHVTELQNFEEENANLNWKDEIMKLNQLEKANATDEADCKRKMEKEKQMQMRRQAYLEQLDVSETKNVNENEIAKGKSKEGKKVQTKKLTKG